MRRADCLVKPKQDDLGPTITEFLKDHASLKGGYYSISTPIQFYIYSGVLEEVMLSLNPDATHAWDIHGDTWVEEDNIFNTKIRHVTILHTNGQKELVNP